MFCKAFTWIKHREEGRRRVSMTKEAILGVTGNAVRHTPADVCVCVCRTNENRELKVAWSFGSMHTHPCVAGWWSQFSRSYYYAKGKCRQVYERFQVKILFHFPFDLCNCRLLGDQPRWCLKIWQVHDFVNTVIFSRLVLWLTFTYG
jgi:hypothetical protein